MKYPIFFFLSVFGFIAVIMMFIKTNNKPKPLYTNIGYVSEMKLNDCYDEAMSQWFLNFNELQGQGHTWQEANKLAEKIAISRYNKCGATLAYIQSLPTLTVER
ncbi:hypothetical protein [Fulvivirga sp.]|uniref:hypothetical protein n=1 Tax=Fulvivirga sp. TaxID=1931237 RepID=UPI0032EE2958